jgi:hypothetical protein
MLLQTCRRPQTKEKIYTNYFRKKSHIQDPIIGLLMVKEIHLDKVSSVLHIYLEKYLKKINITKMF